MSTDPPAQSLAVSNLGKVVRRQWWVVALCVILAAGGAFAYVKVRPVRYQAKRSVSLPVATVTSASGVSSQLTVFGPDPRSLVATRSVLRAAAAAAHIGVGGVDLTGSVNASSTTLTLVATQATAAQAVAVVNAAAARDAALEHGAVAKLAAQSAKQTATVNAELQKILNQLADKHLDPGTRATLETQLSVVKAAATQYDTAQIGYNLALESVAAAPPAIHPSGTVARSKAKVIEIAVVLGLVVGAALALLRDQLSDRIRVKEEVHVAGAPPVLSEVPSVSGRPRPAEVVLDSQSPFAEAFRELRTNLGFLRTERPLRVVLVTSPGPGEGKSFVAAHLAAVSAAAGQNTVLLSTDLRRSTIEQYFDLGATPVTLSDYLVASTTNAKEERPQRRLRLGTERRPGAELAADLDIDRLFGVEDMATRTEALADKLLVASEIEGLQVVATGEVPPNPSELLGSRSMAELLDGLRDSADLVIVDSPPVLAVTDTMVVSAFVDGVIMVVSRAHTSRQAVHDALDRLRRGPAPVVGTVLNRGQANFSSYLYTAPPRAGHNRARAEDPPS